MRALASAGQPVAMPRWLEPTGDVLGQPFFVMDHMTDAHAAATAMSEPWTPRPPAI